MPVLEWKIKLAVLWLVQPVNYVSYILIGLVETEPFAAAVEPGSAPVIAIFFFVPCLMAWISVISPSMSRWPNVVLGGVFAILKLAAAVGLVVEFSAAIFVRPAHRTVVARPLNCNV